jgi:hypothetical protein
MSSDMPEKAPYVVVVSLAKSGTNLVANLMRSLGYKCIGHGLRDSYEELWEKLARFGSSTDNPKDGFSHPDRMLKVLKEYPKYTCLFVHRMEIGSHLLEWCTSNEPRFFYNYRDPRDTLISLVNYLLLRASDHYTEMPWNMIHASILAGFKDSDEQMMFAIQNMESHTARFRNHAWMLHHPSVCKIAYEKLVGPLGGGNSGMQRSTVRDVMLHLGISGGDVEPLLDSLYDRNTRTFYKGRIGAWKDVFTQAHISEFERKYADILSVYGYSGRPDGTQLSAVTVPEAVETLVASRSVS